MGGSLSPLPRPCSTLMGRGWHLWVPGVVGWRWQSGSWGQRWGTGCLRFPHRHLLPPGKIRRKVGVPPLLPGLSGMGGVGLCPSPNPPPPPPCPCPLGAVTAPSPMVVPLGHAGSGSPGGRELCPPPSQPPASPSFGVPPSGRGRAASLLPFKGLSHAVTPSVKPGVDGEKQLSAGSGFPRHLVTGFVTLFLGSQGWRCHPKASPSLPLAPRRGAGATRSPQGLRGGGGDAPG